MLLNISPEELRPVIEAAVIETLGDLLALSEPEAARVVGLESHQLRDERLRGRIGASAIVGRRIRYLRDDLLKYLKRNRTEARDI